MATATNPRYSRVVSADGDQDNSAPVGADNSAGPEAAPVSPMTDTSSVCHQELPADIHQGLVSDEQHGAAEHSDTEFDDQMPTPRELGPLEPRAMTNAAMWLPGCLRRTVLLFLIALLVIFIVVLAALFGLSSRVGRLAAVNPNQSYLWTYLPIAVFTTVAAFWVQVEYRSKQLMPWVLMAQGFQPAKTSMLLDYVSPINIVNLGRSLGNRHWIVFSAVGAAMVLQLATVLSSGLLVSRPTILSNTDTRLTATDAFTGTGRVPAGPRPATTVYGILTSNLSYPSGTHDGYAFQQFTSSDDTLESISALVDVFAADLSCEIGSIANTTYSTSFGAGDNTLEDPPPPSVIIPVESEQTDFIIATRECPQLYISVRHPSLSALNGSFCRGDASGEDAARFVLIWGEWEDVIVPSRSETPSPTFLTFSPRTVVKRDPQFLTILPVETASPTTRAATLPQSTGNVESTREPPTTQPTSTPGFVPSERVFTPSLALVCKPSYSVRKGTVTLRKNANGAVAQSVAFDERDRPSAIPSVTSWDILREFARTIAETSRSLPTLNLQGFLSTSMSQQSPAADPEATMSELARLFRLITAQYANIYLKTAVQMPLLGNSTSQQARLTVDPLSFWLMEASLVFLVLLVGYLYRKSPAMSVAPGDPSTVAGLATILAQSKGTLSKLEGTGHVGIHELHRILQHDTFKTSTSMSSSAAGEGYVTHPSFQIETATSAPAMRDSESKMSSGHDAARTPQLASSVKWHEPFAVTLAGRVLVLAAIVALITTVELLYQRSARNNGLIAIPDPGNVLAHAAWTYVPTAVMVALSLALAALSTEAKLLSPYQQLRRNHGRPRLSRVANAAADPLTRNYLPSLSVVALYRAVRGGDYAVALASLAAMLAPMLAIAAGGLYSVVAVPTTAPVRVLMLDAVVFNATDAADAGLVNAHLVLANNLSDPLWTSGEFALPRLSIVDSEDGVQRRGGDAPIPPGGLLDVVLPASRARLNCTPATPAQVNCGGDSVTGEAYTGRIGGVRIEESREFSGDGPTSGGTGWFGQVYDLTMVANQTAYLNGSQPWECPQVMVAVGHQTAHFIDQVSHLACKPFIEETRVRARFRLPSWELDSPPVAVEDGNARTTVVVWDGASPDFITNSRLFASPLAHNVSDEDLTSFFPLVVYGPDGVPIRELVAAPVDDPDSVFARAVDRTYALIMAQVLNHQRREVTRGGFAAGTETPEAARVFDGTLTGGAGRTEMRLLQNKVVTRVLEALLAAILACALMACVSLRSASGVLPKNPCSVAAVASLLEGSALLRQTLSLTHEVPDGDRSSHWPASWQTAAGREKWSRLGPYCGMGWWDEDGRPVELGTAARGAVRPRRSGLAVRFGIDLHDPKGEDRGMSRQHQDVSVSGWPLLGRDWRPKKS